MPHSRRGLTPLRRLQKNPKIHVSTGEETSGSSLDSRRGLRTWHRLERNPERPLATRMETGLSCGHMTGSLKPRCNLRGACLNSRKSRRFSTLGKMRPFLLRRLKENHIVPLQLPKGPPHPCCNSRNSLMHPSPPERNTEGPATTQEEPRFPLLSLR